jgi:CheY-like chemotaxis protein
LLSRAVPRSRLNALAVAKNPARPPFGMRKTNSPNPAPLSGGSGGARIANMSGATVLHVDDDPNDTALLEAARRKAEIEFRLENVSDGDQAMAYINGAGPYANRARHPWPTLVLLDLKMPRATGFEILRWIRSHPDCKELPVVVLSGSELQEDIRQAYSMGANSYLVKPLGFEALVELVRNITSAWLAGRPRRPAIISSARRGEIHYGDRFRQ